VLLPVSEETGFHSIPVRLNFLPKQITQPVFASDQSLLLIKSSESGKCKVADFSAERTNCQAVLPRISPKF
jgi:hypothetical protein